MGQGRRERTSVQRMVACTEWSAVGVHQTQHGAWRGLRRTLKERQNDMHAGNSGGRECSICTCGHAQPGSKAGLRGSVGSVVRLGRSGQQFVRSVRSAEGSGAGTSCSSMQEASASVH